MSSQIFKKKLPIKLLYDVLTLNGIINIDNIIVNDIVFRRSLYNGSMQSFMDSCKEYYHKSKMHYLEKKLTYTMFTTVLRQICNDHKIKYTSQIKYNKSKYSIHYYIFFDQIY
jgi:hypothetical protein